MKVSVVIPCFNRASELVGAIRTVLDQTHKNFEIIVVDDGSEDVELAALIVEEFCDPRIIFHRIAVNRGQTAATNVGMLLASGDYIALLDTDDRWHARKLELQVSAMLEEHDDRVVVYPQSEVVTNATGSIKRSIMPIAPMTDGESVARYLFCRRGFIQSSGILFSRERTRGIRMRDGLRRHTDYDFLISLQQHGFRFRMIHEPLVVVNWIDVHLRKGARDMSPSFDFLSINKGAFDKEAATFFVLYQILKPLICERKRFGEVCLGLRKIYFCQLGVVGWTSLISWILFKDHRLVELGLACRRSCLMWFRGESCRA
jgi:glycosyltransferase involved in cell wall biosynthesis